MSNRKKDVGTYCFGPFCIKNVNLSVSFNSANITTPSSFEVKTETA
jgi:hypothetical protein